MENKLEQLLNSLIEKGWKPRGEYKIHSCRYIEGKFKSEYTIAGLLQVLYRSLRELVSKESGLWQFVCENELTIKIWNGSEWKHNSGDEEEFNRWDYQYRLIETSLKNEDELEQFLLDNIIINEQA